MSKAIDFGERCAESRDQRTRISRHDPTNGCLAVRSDLLQRVSRTIDDVGRRTNRVFQSCLQRGNEEDYRRISSFLRWIGSILRVESMVVWNQSILSSMDTESNETNVRRETSLSHRSRIASLSVVSLFTSLPFRNNWIFFVVGSTRREHSNWAFPRRPVDTFSKWIVRSSAKISATNSNGSIRTSANTSSDTLRPTPRFSSTSSKQLFEFVRSFIDFTNNRFSPLDLRSTSDGHRRLRSIRESLSPA